MMQRVSLSRDQWQMNAHGLDSLNYVTTRSNGQESLQSRTRSSTHVDLEKVFLKMFFWRKFKWYFFEQNHPPFFFFCSKYFLLSKKFKRKLKKQYFLKRDLLKRDFWLEKVKKDENTRKTEQKKQKKRKTQQAHKNF